MRRRQFLGLLVSAGASLPLAVHAQEAGRTYRLGFLVPSGRNSPPIMAFFDELRRNGFIEGRNLIVLSGGFEVRDDQVASTVAALVEAAPDAIVASGIRFGDSLQRATRMIPIVAMSEDMLVDGLVASLSRPEGNTTGISILSPELELCRRLGDEIDQAAW
jgi:putative ABC transport system substrate-binding protein